ncbi:MAG: hypothetical protein FWC11_04235, partial [Firmicutes bacterium]|nr:hypothetical protein [Bacillota bacterium]
GVFAIIGGAITMAGKTAGPVFMLLAWLMAIASAIGLNWMAIPAAVFFFIAMILGFAGVKKAKRARNSGDGNNDRFNSSNQNQQW